MRKRTLAREYALQILYQQEMNPEELQNTLTAFWRDQDRVTPEIKDYAELVVKGTLDHVQDLDQIITKYADNWQLHRMAAVDRNILRLSAYEMLYRDDIPPKVSINEAVNMAKKFSQLDSGKFVNGILDKISHSEKPSTAKPQ